MSTPILLVLPLCIAPSERTVARTSSLVAIFSSNLHASSSITSSSANLRISMAGVTLLISGGMLSASGLSVKIPLALQIRTLPINHRRRSSLSSCWPLCLGRAQWKTKRLLNSSPLDLSSQPPEMSKAFAIPFKNAKWPIRDAVSMLDRVRFAPVVKTLKTRGDTKLAPLAIRFIGTFERLVHSTNGRGRQLPVTELSSVSTCVVIL
mmetsp:Transcript_74997/g.150776  ORF Transcript_74997/g.150776 Transcript_74997/m.150776 type:complete len:207 (-) Transcript_74997:150-770(-)